jgi:hypothetical protein
MGDEENTKRKLINFFIIFKCYRQIGYLNLSLFLVFFSCEHANHCIQQRIYLFFVVYTYYDY